MTSKEFAFPRSAMRTRLVPRLAIIWPDLSSARARRTRASASTASSVLKVKKLGR